MYCELHSVCVVNSSSPAWGKNLTEKAFEMYRHWAYISEYLKNNLIFSRKRNHSFSKVYQNWDGEANWKEEADGLTEGLM